MSKKKKTTAPGSPKLSLAFYALAFIVILIILGKIIRLIMGLGQPVTPQFVNASELRSWNGTTPINLVMKAADLSVINYNPADKKFTVIAIPGESYINVPRGYGSWPIGSIYSLGEEEKTGRGASLLKDSIASLLGQPIDRFILVNSPQTSQQIVNQMHSNLFTGLFLLNQIKTDLTPLEELSLVFAISQARSDKIVDLDLSETNITRSILLPDSTRVLGVDNIRLDLFVREKLIDEGITREALPIAIYNATDHPGLAQDASRIITNLGGNVITTSSTESSLINSSIIVMNGDKQSLLKSYTFNRLTGIFSPACFPKGCTPQDPKLDTSRAQLIVVLGEDYYLQNYQHN